MATTLGISGDIKTLAAPTYGQDGYTKEPIDVGTMHELADGSIVYDSTTTRWRFRLKWNAITGAERDVIETQFLIKTEQTFSPPDSATTYTVFCAKNGYVDQGYLEDGGGTPRYYCSLILEEAS